MARRFSKARRQGGIPKARVENPELQRMLDTMAEMLETLSGVDETKLARAVTFQDLKDNGFEIDLTPPRTLDSGGPGQVNSPGDFRSITIPLTEGKTSECDDFVRDTDNDPITTTHIAKLTWNKPSGNVKILEIWRSHTNNDRADASFAKHVILGPEVDVYEFCQSAGNTTYYYWIRALGTDGNYSDWEPSGATSGITVTT